MTFRAFAVLALFGFAGPGHAETPLPFKVGGSFELTDQHGNSRSEVSPEGHAQLLFFGYASCQNICSASLPLMADVSDELDREGLPVTPVMITVAPDQDLVETMKEPLAALHPDFIGLTGQPADLQVAYDAFAIEIEPLFQDPEYGWIYAHGSFIYLLDPEGRVLTLLPPVLSAGDMAEIVRGYVDPSGRS